MRMEKTWHCWNHSDFLLISSILPVKPSGFASKIPVSFKILHRLSDDFPVEPHLPVLSAPPGYPKGGLPYPSVAFAARNGRDRCRWRYCCTRPQAYSSVFLETRGGCRTKVQKSMYIYIIKNPHQLGYDTSTQKIHMSWDTTPLYPLITGTANPCRDIHQSTIFDTPLSFLVLTINHPICGPILSHTHTWLKLSNALQRWCIGNWQYYATWWSDLPQWR